MTTCRSVALSTALLVTFGQALRSQQVWAVEAAPLVDFVVPSLNASHHGELPAGVVQFRNGLFAVVGSHGGVISFFDSRGKPFPRKGKQTYPFRHIAWMGQCGVDSLFVWDLMRRRMSVVNVKGDVVREFALLTTDFQPPAVLACSRFGIIAYQQLPSRIGQASPGSAFVRGRESVMMADSEGIAGASIPNVSTGEYVSFEGGGAPRPLGKRTLLAMSRKNVFVGTADSGFIHVYSTHGRYIRSVTLPITSVLPTRAAAAAAIDEVVSSIPTESQHKVRSKLLQLEMPREMPRYRALLTDNYGMLWVVVSALHEKTEMLVFDGNAKHVATVRLPVPLNPFVIGRNRTLARDFILGTYRDDRGRSHIASFELGRSSQQAAIR